jgi:hypothetical protein
MAPWTFLIGFFLVAQGLASSFTTMSTQGRPVADARNDVALNYVSARTLGSLPFCDVFVDVFVTTKFPRLVGSTWRG